MKVWSKPRAVWVGFFYPKHRLITGYWQLNLPMVTVTGAVGLARSRPVILAICRFRAMRILYRLVNRIVFSE
jgi:hypothetical protein